MNRRSFFGKLGLGVAAVVAAPKVLAEESSELKEKTRIDGLTSDNNYECACINGECVAAKSFEDDILDHSAYVEYEVPIAKGEWVDYYVGGNHIRLKHWPALDGNLKKKVKHRVKK